jgi:hypothetical protein
MRIFSVLSIFVLCLNAHSKETLESEYDQLNRSLIASPRAVSLNGADLSFNDGAYAGYSPSNLIRDSLNSLQLSYADFFGSAFSSSALSYQYRISPHSAFSITTGYLHIPDITDNRSLDTTSNGEVIFDNSVKITNSSQIHFRAGFGFSSDKNKPLVVSGGVAMNASRNRLVDYTGYGLGVDLGSSVMMPEKGLSAVLLIENVTRSYTYWSSSYSEKGKPHIKLGLGWEIPVKYLYGTFRVGYTSPDLLSNEGINGFEIDEVDDELVIENPEKYTLSKDPEILVLGAKLGLEFTIMQVFAIRGGFARDRFSFGAGLSLFEQRAAIDFAYMTHSLPGTYQISLSYKW